MAEPLATPSFGRNQQVLIGNENAVTCKRLHLYSFHISFCTNKHCTSRIGIGAVRTKTDTPTVGTSCTFATTPAISFWCTHSRGPITIKLKSRGNRCSRIFMTAFDDQIWPEKTHIESVLPGIQNASRLLFRLITILQNHTQIFNINLFQPPIKGWVFQGKTEIAVNKHLPTKII